MKLRKKDLRIVRKINHWKVCLDDFVLNNNFWSRKEAEYYKDQLWKKLKEFEEEVNL